VPEVADIFRIYGPGYLARFGPNMLPSHRRALADLRDCRTPAMGGRLYVCDHCGHQDFVYHSCRNRACPKCHRKDTEAWLARRRDELLPVPYFHVVFTVPNGLRDLVRRHQTALYPLLMKAAAKALIQLAADPHYVGGLIGVIGILHTWSRTLVYHPHVHCLVPGGGASRDGQWLSARKNFLVPVKALSKLFRGSFLHLAAKALPQATIPASARKRPWVVYCKPALQGTDNVLTYLGRYVHRVAITNNRILSLDEGNVCFRYRNCRDSHGRVMTLGAYEFIRRFLQHVLPKGFHKVRYYGLCAPANRRLLHQIQLALPATDLAASTAQPSVQSQAQPLTTPQAPRPCPSCNIGTLIFLRRLCPQPRPPP
jgi:hypothetical protein